VLTGYEPWDPAASQDRPNSPAGASPKPTGEGRHDGRNGDRRRQFSGKPGDWADVKTEIVATIENAGYSYITKMGACVLPPSQLTLAHFQFLGHGRRSLSGNRRPSSKYWLGQGGLGTLTNFNLFRCCHLLRRCSACLVCRRRCLAVRLLHIRARVTFAGGRFAAAQFGGRCVAQGP
jgi:hypothetical protein